MMLLFITQANYVVCVCLCSAGAAVGAAAEVPEDPRWREAEWKCHSTEGPPE